MQRVVLALLAVAGLAGCDAIFGSDPARDRCSSSASCPAGQYCASTSDGGVCWPDAAAPTVTGVAVACDRDPCLRDGALTVEAQVADAEELGAVTVSLDLDGDAMRLPMARVAGALHRATLDLAGWPFAGLARTVTATVRAVDGARNETVVVAPVGERVGVTRVRGAIVVADGVALTPAAVGADGTVVCAGGTKAFFVPPGATAADVSSVSFSGTVVQAPSVGSSAVWVAAGGRVYALSGDGASVLNGAGYDTGGAIAGPPALSAGLATEVAFVASAAGRVEAVVASAVANGFVDRTGAVDPYSSGPILDGDAVLYAASASAAPAAATLRQFTWDGALSPGVAPAIGTQLSAPLSVASNGSVWSITSDVGKAVVETTAAGGAGTSIPLASNSAGGVVILPGGDVAFCEAATLRRFSPAGEARWAAPPALAGVGLTPLLLAGGDATFLVPTRAGTVHAIAADGAELWSATLSPGAELREGTIFREPEAPTSTAWFTSADGRLHGLVVDGWLDPAAPWPKAWHDPRNTGNAATGF